MSFLLSAVAPVKVESYIMASRSVIRNGKKRKTGRNTNAMDKLYHDRIMKRSATGKHLTTGRDGILSAGTGTGYIPEGGQEHGEASIYRIVPAEREIVVHRSGEGVRG
jgi:hypothetical protein